MGGPMSLPAGEASTQRSVQKCEQDPFTIMFRVLRGFPTPF